MSYLPSVNKLQIGIEANYGDEAVDTIFPAGIIDFNCQPKVETERIPDKRGDTMPAWSNFVKRRWAEGSIRGYVDYERFNIFLDSMFGYDATSPHTYLGQLTWATAEKSMSFRYGQTGALYLVGGVLPKTMTLTYESGKPIIYDYSYFGTDVSDGASFAALSVDTPDWAIGTTTTIYIDEGAGATMGTTALADTAFKAVATITCEREPVWHLGDQVPDSYKRGKWGGSMNLVLEGTAVTLGHFGDIIDATATQKVYNIRLRTTDGSNILDLDFCGTCEEPPLVITDLDGIVTVEMNLLPSYNTVYTSCWGANLTIA